MTDPSSRSQASVQLAETTLRHNISMHPIPGAPPRHSRGGGDLGLAFLTSALRLNHVTRVSEQIEIIETGSARRRVSLDLSLRLLDSTQDRAGRRLNEIRGDGRLIRPNVAQGNELGVRGPLIWVPIARLSRHAVAPVEVIDAEGRLIPRLTQAETLQLTQAGIYRTFRNILRAKPSASDSTSHLYHFLHHLDEARWLLEGALAHTIVSGAVADDVELPKSADCPRARIDALKVLEVMHAEGDDAFFKLLALCISDYLVIVGLDSTKNEHHLTYEGPLLLAGEHRRERRAARLNPRRAGIVVEYTTPITTGSASYHLSVDVAPDVHICKFMLQTSHDGAEANELSQRFRALAGYIADCAGDATAVRTSKVIEYELQDVFARLSLLTQARHEDWRSFASQFGARPLQGGPLGKLVDICNKFAAGELTKLVETHYASAAELEGVAALIDDSDLGADVVVENDPRENGAHVYWRNRRIGAARSLDATIATTRMQLIDDSPSLIGSVLITSAALALIVYGVAAFSLHSMVWFAPGTEVNKPQLSQADAIVAVLLLTPGFLFTRLDLPSSRTIIGALRELPRLLAVLAVASTTYAAIAISTGIDNAESARVHFGISLCLLVLVILVGMVHRRAIRSAIHETTLADLHPPRWLTGTTALGGNAEPAPDIVFHAVGTLDVSPYSTVTPRVSR